MHYCHQAFKTLHEHTQFHPINGYSFKKQVKKTVTAEESLSSANPLSGITSMDDALLASEFLMNMDHLISSLTVKEP
jgi:hypothetical protein